MVLHYNVRGFCAPAIEVNPTLPPTLWLIYHDILNCELRQVSDLICHLLDRFCIPNILIAIFLQINSL